MLTEFRKKPTPWGLGFLCVRSVWALTACLLFVPAAWSDDCPPEGALEQARLERVIDGDTLRLEDGRRVRFLGVDAPELGRDGEPDEPLAREARRAVMDFFADDKRVYLSYDVRREDRFGRTLAYIYDSRQRSLEAHLLARGLAFQVVVPPSLAQADCFARQELRARQQGLGVWAVPALAPVAAGNLNRSHAGFRLVQGRVAKVTRAGGSVWLELDGPLVLQVSAEDQERHFPGETWSDWLGRRVEVRGWIVDRSDSAAARRGFKPLMLPLRTPHSAHFLD